jgi:peptidoglycan/LPS O-acetylase OafA/YrhL
MHPEEAVLIFFLLSGFVIYISSAKHADLTFSNYIKRRFVRIFPITICAFILSTIVFCFNNLHFSSTYGHVFSFIDVKNLVGNVLMLQDNEVQPHIIIPTFLKNYALWSLSYEWWFYVMFFPLFIYFANYNIKFSIFYVLGISLIAWFFFLNYPNHILLVIVYFLLWWAGVESAKIYSQMKNFTFKAIFPVLLSIFIMSLIISLPVLKGLLIEHKSLLQVNALYPISTYLHFYCGALMFLTLGLIWWKFNLIGFNAIFGVFKMISPISFALYVVHFPILWLDLSFLHSVMIITIAKLALIFLIAYLLEIKLQPLINRYARKKPDISQ